MENVCNHQGDLLASSSYLQEERNGKVQKEHKLARKFKRGGGRMEEKAQSEARKQTTRN